MLCQASFSGHLNTTKSCSIVCLQLKRFRLKFVEFNRATWQLSFQVTNPLEFNCLSHNDELGLFCSIIFQMIFYDCCYCYYCYCCCNCCCDLPYCRSLSCSRCRTKRLILSPCVRCCRRVMCHPQNPCQIIEKC